MRAYVIDWLDHGEATAVGAWSSIETLDQKPFLLRSVAFIVKETEDSILISHTARDQECTTPFLILRSTIVRMEPIKLPPLRRNPKRVEGGGE